MDAKTIELTAEIAAAYASNNRLAAADLPALIQSVSSALMATANPPPEPAEVRTPAVPIRRSVQPDFIVCLEDGRQFKSLKRHLQTRYGLTPEAYREKWGLPKTYPMVAPNYAASRAALAKAMGLGAGGRGGTPTTAQAPSAPAVPPIVETARPAPEPRKVGRPRKPPAAAAAPATKSPRGGKPIALADDDFT
jgi:predicted transcriptional regulator